MAKSISKPPKLGEPSQNSVRRSWLEANGKIYCFIDLADLCIVSNFVEVKSISAFHDSELARCTKKINAMFSTLKRNNKSQKRDLAILKTDKGLLLAWVEHGAHGPHDPGAAKALGIR
jgi:hypothetical protein